MDFSERRWLHETARPPNDETSPNKTRLAHLPGDMIVLTLQYGAAAPKYLYIGLI